MTKLSRGVEFLIKQQKIRPAQKLVPESNLIPAPEMEETGVIEVEGSRVIEVGGATVQVIRRHRRRGQSCN
jgi:hypothetical protein